LLNVKRDELENLKEKGEVLFEMLRNSSLALLLLLSYICFGLPKFDPARFVKGKRLGMKAEKVGSRLDGQREGKSLSRCPTLLPLRLQPFLKVS
jgi:hypothetical protein